MFQFHSGLIKRIDNINQLAVESKFQFHSGLIKSHPINNVKLMSYINKSDGFFRQPLIRKSYREIDGFYFLQIVKAHVL